MNGLEKPDGLEYESERVLWAAHGRARTGSRAPMPTATVQAFGRGLGLYTLDEANRTEPLRALLANANLKDI
jgi:hypothetical protein